MRLGIQAMEMSFPCIGAGHTLQDRVTELLVELLRPHIERNQLRWFRHLTPGWLLLEVYQAWPTGTRLRGCPGNVWRDYISKLAWEKAGWVPVITWPQGGSSELAIQPNTLHLMSGLYIPLRKQPGLLVLCYTKCVCSSGW